MLSLYCADGWSEILPGLHMGGHDRAGGADEYPICRVVIADEFDLVISLYRRHGYGPAAGVEHHELLIPDGMLLPTDAARVEALADLAAAAVREGRKTLLRCQAGLNRSGLLTALVLIRLGHTPAQAVDLVRARRDPRALFNEHFLTYLESRRG